MNRNLPEAVEEELWPTSRLGAPTDMPTGAEIIAYAVVALSDHKATCPRCADTKRQMCEVGRDSQNHLWDCQEASASIPKRQEER